MLFWSNLEGRFFNTHMLKKVYVEEFATAITCCLLYQVANLRHLEKEKSEKSFVRKASVQVTIDCRFLNRSHWVLCWQGLDPCRRRHISRHFRLLDPPAFAWQFVCCSNLNCSAGFFFSAAGGTEHQSETARICIHNNTQKTPHGKLHGLTVCRLSNRQCFIQSCNRMLSSHQARVCVETFEQVYQDRKDIRY